MHIFTIQQIGILLLVQNILSFAVVPPFFFNPVDLNVSEQVSSGCVYSNLT
jgi:hypothetical protein